MVLGEPMRANHIFTALPKVPTKAFLDMLILFLMMVLISLLTSVIW